MATIIPTVGIDTSLALRAFQNSMTPSVFRPATSECFTRFFTVLSYKLSALATETSIIIRSFQGCYKSLSGLRITLGEVFTRFIDSMIIKQLKDLSGSGNTKVSHALSALLSKYF